MTSSGASILQITERVHQVGWEVKIPVLITALGMRVFIYRKPADAVIQEVYGPDSQAEGTKISEVNALILGDEWTVFDFRNVGTFEKGWMYCLASDLATYKVIEGDVVKFADRTDRKVRRYKIEQPESIGHTLEILKRFRLSSLGD
jgi:hypothetical protein